MNLDDFIFSENMGTPAGFMSPPSADRHGEEASGIPIKSRKNASINFVPQSVPHHQQRAEDNEFNYVQRHHRKTSIDERRVSAHFGLWFTHPVY